MKKTITTLCTALLLLAGLAWHPLAAADDKKGAKPHDAASEPLNESVQGNQYTAKGADTCLDCHDPDSDTATFTTAGIFKSKHARRGDPRAPFGPGGLQCEACHGPGGMHVQKGSRKSATINNFEPDSIYSVQYRNNACLTCHQGRARNAWHAGAHDRAQLACTSCHRIHTGNDLVLAKATQAEVCYRCHKQQRADFYKASAHPVRYQKMACSDCHNPHGTTNPSMLIKPTLNQTCYTCHADKRGPLLWEHAPVAEDCSLCHAAHGAVRPALLTKTPPLLCQQCHAAAGHPSVERTADSLPGGSAGPSIFLLAGGCTNCHTQVHGSNHPAGAKLLR